MTEPAAPVELPVSPSRLEPTKTNPAHAESLARAARAWNDWLDQHGSFADEYNTL